MTKYKATEYYNKANVENKYSTQDILDIVAYTIRAGKKLNGNMKDGLEDIKKDFEEMHPGMLKTIISRIERHVIDRTGWEEIGSFSLQEKKTMLAFIYAYESLTRQAFLGTSASLLGVLKAK